MYGKTCWFFPDGERPPFGESELKGHESIVILNPNRADANVRLTLYFENEEPVRDIPVFVGAERVRCLRSHEAADFGEHTIPPGLQYALQVESDTPVVVQYGRLDPRQVNLAYYTAMGYAD